MSRQTLARAGHSLLFSCVIVALGAGAAAQSSHSGRTVWDGVYTEAQAARGQSQYATHCSNCHRDDLAGYSSVLLGNRFMEKYREASLHLLFDKTKTTMPRGAAGSLSDETYVDIVSYLLKMNQFPAGSNELSTELLPSIQLVSKGGPEPVPNFSLIKVVGCLSQGEEGRSWVLTNTTVPSRTGDPQMQPEDRTAAEAVALGSETFDLMVSAAYSPERVKGHKVEVRGLLIRRPTLSRINITSLETLHPTCGG